MHDRSNRLGMPSAHEFDSPLAFQLIRARFATKQGVDLEGFIRQQHWDSTTRELVRISTKAPVSDADFGDAAGIPKVGDYISPTLKTRSVLDDLLRLGAVRVPKDTRLLVSGQPVVAGTSTNGKAIRVSAQSLTGTSMVGYTFGALSVATKESLNYADADLEALANANLVNGIDDAINRALLDPANAGDARTPASIANGAVTIPSAGSSILNIAHDFNAAFREVVDLGSDGRNLVAIVHPRTAGNLATMRTVEGGVPFPEMSPYGGRIFGVPCLATAAMPNLGTPTDTSIVVVDASDLVVVDEGAVVSLSDATMIEMDSAPTGITTTPVAASKQMVSMFQSDTVALKTIRRCNWELRHGLIAVIASVDY